MSASPDDMRVAVVPSRSDIRFRRFLLLTVLIVAGLRLWRSPWSASDLAVVPDSVEYAIGAQRLVTLGHYDIAIEGVAYPPRFAPWFSLLLVPAYAFAPGELGIGIIPVLVFALLAVAAAFVIGERLAGEWGAVAAALALICFGEFRRGSMKIMSDVPALAFALWACVWYLRLRSGSKGESHGSNRGSDREAPVGNGPGAMGRSDRETAADSAGMTTWLLAGATCAYAFALRLELLALCIPFLLLALTGKKPAIARAALFAAPILAVVVASALYDKATFGSWTRTGYRFWLPDLHRSLSNIVSPAFTAANVASLASLWGLCAIGFGGVGAWRLARVGSSAGRGVLTFLCLGALPVSLFHLFYFYPDLRFHLLSFAILCVLAGAGLVTFLNESLRRRARWSLPLIALLSLALPASPASEPHRRIVAEALARETPPNAVIVSAIDPAYLEPTVLRGTQRRIVPFSRSVEYAARSVMIDWLDASKPHGAAVTTPPNASDSTDAIHTAHVCAFTADEDPQRIAAWVRDGVPVYLDASFIPKSFALEKILSDDLELVPSAAHTWLSRFELRK